MLPTGTSAGLRPGTTMRPGSQARPGTRQQAGIGGSLTQSVAVSAQAAVTREGMRAASRAGTSAGPGRQVGDRSYYIGLLRPKIAELRAEIERLNEQERLMEKNSSVLSQLQQRSKALSEEITKQKGTLADVNVAVECHSSSKDTQSLKDSYSKLQKQNADKRKEVDELFLQVKAIETETTTAATALEEEMQQLDRRLLNENQDYGQYKAARDEAFRASDLVLERQHEVRTLAAKQELLVAKLTTDTDKRRAAETLRSILRKRHEKDELTKQCSLSVEEEKNMLISQVKATRSDIEAMERQVNDVRDTLQESKVRLTALDDEMRTYSGDNVKAYQELVARDKEMQTFMNEFPQRDREESDKIAKTQEQISELLSRISQALQLQRQMPEEGAPSALRALNTEVDARLDQINNDQKTHERLEKELLERKAELDKVASLDRKIKEELESHAQRMQEQKDEMTRYTDLDSMREQVEELRRVLISQKSYLSRVRDGGKVRVNELSAQYEQSRKKLSENAIHASLSTQEQKLRVLWQSTFGLEDFVRLQEKDTQYMPIKAECLRLMEEVNLVLKDPGHLSGMAAPPTININ